MAFDFRVQRQGLVEQPAMTDRVTYASGEQVGYTDTKAYPQCIRRELPNHPATGFRYETPADDLVIRRQMDGILYDLYDEGNSHPLEGYGNAPWEDMVTGGTSL